MSLKAINLEKVKTHVSNPKVWIVIGVSVAGILILTAETRRRRLKGRYAIKEDYGAFIERFELLPFLQPPPPAAKQPLSGLTFAISDVFDVKEYVTGFGNPDWKRTHEEAGKTAIVVTTLLKDGATCVGRTVMDELSFGTTGENSHYGTPTNPAMPSYIPGGSSSGSAVAVAAQLVDFSIGTDTLGGVRIPASFCGVLGFRPSHGVVSTIGVLPNSQSLDTVGIFARDPSVLHRVGHVLLRLNPLEPRRTRRIIVADDLFQLSKVPQQKTVYIVSKVTEKLSGYQQPKHMNIGQYISSNVPGLKYFLKDASNLQNGTNALKALSSAMLLLQRYEFKTNHEEWIKTVKPKFGSDVADGIHAAISATHENIKAYYKVRTEMRAALRSLLKDDGILVIPTVADTPLKLSSKKSSLSEFNERLFALLSITTMSGCCQVSIPFGKHEESPIGVSFIAFHGSDKFLLDTVLDMYQSLQGQVSAVTSLPPSLDLNGNMDASELLKEKGNAAYKGKQWNKAVSYYTEAIKLDESNATFYSNRAAAYLELGCFQQAEEDCSKAISLDKKNVKAYLRRGTARESVLYNKEALQDFKHALVLEPQNKVAKEAEKRLRKLDIQQLLAAWKPYFDTSVSIFIHAPSHNLKLLFNTENSLSTYQKTIIKHIPLTIKKPTFKEAQRLYNILTQISTEPNQETKKASTFTLKKENPKNISKKRDISEDGFVKKAEYYNHYMSSPLHEASKGGNVDKVMELLEQGLDPCVLDERGRTPYRVAVNKEVRNVFRRFMGLNFDKWDWEAAKVPSPLTKEMEQSQAKKDAKRKARAKELKLLCKAREKKAQQDARNSRQGTHRRVAGVMVLVIGSLLAVAFGQMGRGRARKN